MEPDNPFAQIAAQYGGVGPDNPFSRFLAESNRRRQLEGDLPSVPGGIARQALQGLTFGFGDEALAGLTTAGGFAGDYSQAVAANRRANAAFAAHYPATALASEAVGALPTFFGGGVVGQGSRAVGRGRTVATTGQYVGQNARIGATYGAAAGVGNADPSTDAGWLENALQRVAGGGVGGFVGGLTGAGIGVVGNVLNNASRLAPGLRRESNAAAMLETDAAGAATPAATVAAREAALRDISMELRRDSVDPAALVNNMLPTYRNGRGTLNQRQTEALVSGHLAGETDAAIAQQLGVSTGVVRTMRDRFETEIRPRLEGSNIMEIMRTPTRPNEVVAIPNTTSLAYQATRSEGRGQQVAQQRLLQRQADEGDEMAGLIGRTFGAENFDQYARQYREMLQGRARRTYAELHANNPGEVLNVNAIPDLARLRRDPVFRRALDFAARAAQIEGDDALAAAIRAGSLDSRAVDHLQRQLRLAGQGLTDRSASHLAGVMRDRVLAVAEQRMPEFWGTRGMFRMGVAADEALDLGRSLSVKRGGTSNEAWQFFQTNNGRLAGIDREIRNTERLIRQEAPGSNAVANLNNQLQMAQAERALVHDIVDNFRRSFGAGLLDSLNSSGNANRFLTGAEARVFQARVREILGRDAQPFLDAISAAQRQKQTVNAMYGNSETAPRLMKALRQNPIYDVGAGIATMNPGRALRGAGEMVSNRLREVRYERIADMLSITDMRTVFELTRRLRDIMQRAQPPSPEILNRAVMGIVNRLPAPVANRMNQVLGGEFRGADVMTFLSGILAAHNTASMYKPQQRQTT